MPLPALPLAQSLVAPLTVLVFFLASVLRDGSRRSRFCGLPTRGGHCLPPRRTDGEDARCDGRSLCRKIGFDDSAAYNFISDLYDAARCGSDSHEE